MYTSEFLAKYGFTEEEWTSCLKVLSQLKDNPFENPDNDRFGALVTKIHKTAKKQLRKSAYQQDKSADLAVLKQATIAKNALNGNTLFDHNTSDQKDTYTDLNFPKNCYSCNQAYQKVHFFYHRLCPTCAELNYKHRNLKVDLNGRNIILTGGRVKIGYATSLMLLRSKANLTVTTRFPALALTQFSKEIDYETWKDKLTVYGLDLRNLSAVEEFISYYKSQHKSLDVLINNAAQTIKYEKDYYQPLIAKENQLLPAFRYQKSFTQNQTPVISDTKALESIKQSVSDLTLNRFGQPVDLRTKNSWNSTLEEVSTYELLEVNLINQISPFLLIREFTPLLKASTFAEKFIINVTSSEGQFSYHNKTIFHPHTNMTKAALNMMTKTSAAAYAKDKIFMNSVDVGWVSTGAHEILREKQFEAGYIPPLDPVDGAARILHPVYEGLENKVYIAGELLKNYQIIDW
ncbi:SDR family NAD(P)-dependent oxidoreductase [Chondrinema litorale]|uniref:SDR family NAD(P)-dependent oxidoreductase n=1 Tax=Chondrinema litorale TaxID=2994555 RepID=UPI002543A1C1|nr:SDR family NAD(P)-dependent oxidoreductase [Chondrinema litorale]UZR96186.1 SDR family NAD(P)-dependent oxidoreductase [Chondrinema litorale]